MEIALTRVRRMVSHDGIEVITDPHDFVEVKQRLKRLVSPEMAEVTMKPVTRCVTGEDGVRAVRMLNLMMCSHSRQ